MKNLDLLLASMKGVTSFFGLSRVVSVPILAAALGEVRAHVTALEKEVQALREAAKK